MSRLTRRQFVGKSAKGATTVAVGTAMMELPGQLAAGSPNNKVVVAIMGVGGRGTDLMKKIAVIPDVVVKYVCEVEDARGSAAVATVEKIQGSRPKHVVDIRQVLDDKEVHGVVVATLEHWHALATVWACQAGKEVYVEKNISLYIWEGRKMMEAAREVWPHCPGRLSEP